MVKNDLKLNLIVVGFLALLFAFAIPSKAQSDQQNERDSNSGQESIERGHQRDSPSGNLGHGASDIAKGAAKGSVDLGKGAAGGATSLATGHPIDAGSSVGKGAVGFGRHAGVGAAKGTYKIGKGIGGLFKKLAGKS